MSLFKPLTVSCSTQTGSGIDDLPVPILEKALRLVEYFECEIYSGGGDVMSDLKKNILPIKICILEDELLIYLMENNLRHVRETMMDKLHNYMDNKIGNFLKTIFGDKKMTRRAYETLMGNLKIACK